MFPFKTRMFIFLKEKIPIFTYNVHIRQVNVQTSGCTKTRFTVPQLTLTSILNGNSTLYRLQVKAAEYGGQMSEDSSDYTAAYKYCHSQFTDTANHRRSGWNTWQDESGVYANSTLKSRTPVYQRTKPIADTLK